ncbi:MAG TPA: hypothetical protein VKJ07_12045, partial [Mycobacteriales bacterium]|nr:hypothetical protein [Mycobacteriales bacterium]
MVRSEPVTLTVHVTLCGFSPPNVTVAAAIASVASPPGDTFPRGAVGSFSVFAGDRVTVSAAATSTCSAVSTDGLTFQWTLLEKPAGSTAVLNASDLASPAFFADMQGAYKLQAVVTDRLGNLARSTLLTVTTQTCGKNLINASVIDNAGARPFDAHILSVATSSDDDDLNKCPARFANSYSVGWGAAATPASAAFSFGSTSGSTVTFTPLANASYVVTASVRASSGSTTTAITAISASCVTGVAAGAVSISAVAPPFNDGFTRAPGQFFRDDAVTLSAAPTSTCQSNPRFTVSFALTNRPVGSSAVLSSASFVADKPGGPYIVEATIGDGIGHSATTTATFTAELCGANSANAAIFDDTAGTAAPFDRRSLRVVPTSTDDDSQRCPARFAQTYSFAWTVLVQSARPGTLSTPAAQTTIFTPGGSAIYQLQALVTGSNGRSALASIAVDATCSAPFVSATSVGAAFTGQDASFVRSTARVFRDDVVTVSTSGSSACFSRANAGLTYEWTLTRSGSAASINNATASSASFTVDTPSASYTATVVVRDALGNASAPQSATFTASSCGANPIMADVQDLAGAKPFDDHTLTAVFASGRTTFSDDDDGSKCPTHFAGQYSF